MSDRSMAFVYAPQIERLKYPGDCPFITERAGLTRRKLRSFGLLGTEGRVEVEPRKGSAAELERFHSPSYLAELRRAAAGGLTPRGAEMGLGGPDTPVFPDLFEYGAWACGAALTAAGLILDGKADVVFDLLGGFHHAMPEKASGFSYVNDVALACLRLADAGQRVFYLDLDAHHGDGMQAAFYQRSDVMTVSMHETGKTLYPWTGFEDEIGEGPGLGFNINVPLPPGTYDEAFLLAFDRVVAPALTAFFPDVIVLELGMDILAGDPLTHLSMTNNVVVSVLDHLLGLRHPILVLGGGGYHVENTVRGWALAWRTCCGVAEEEALAFGMGRPMFGSSQMAGGLRDRALPVSAHRRRTVEGELGATLDALAGGVLRVQGIRPYSAWRVTAQRRI
jgi:acetoin utilization protein AcuC